MRILLSAFSCAPHQGSEPGVGWRWALELAREHDVVVLTDTTRRALIEPELACRPVPRLRVIYVRPRWLQALPLNARTAQVLYLLWQFSLLPTARRLHQEHAFDLAWHITYGVFRHPSFLGLLGIPFVFGPVGGGEDVPWTLKRSIGGSQALREWGRYLANRLALIDPLLRWSLSRAVLILVKTQESRAALPAPCRARSQVWSEIGVDAAADARPSLRSSHQPLRALFAGRLLGLKGVHLALRAVALARSRGVPVELRIAGQGPYESPLRALATELQLPPEAVQWLGQVPQQRLFELYREAHCLLFPSLHDSSGNVVLEAQAQACPVVCLDCGGPAALLGQGAGIAIPVDGATEQAVVSGMAAALERLHADEPARQAMGIAAHQHALQASWHERVQGALGLLGKVVHIPSAADGSAQAVTGQPRA